jgi:hypothetical protein
MSNKLQKYIKLITMRRHIKSIIKNHLRFVENPQSFWGSINDEDEKEIIALTKKAVELPGPIIEIGSLFGFTTQLIATYKPIEKKLIAIENFSWNSFSLPPDDHRLFWQRSMRYCVLHCNTSLFDGSNQDFYQSYDGEKPAMVFIDASHEYEDVKEDIAWALNHAVPIIAGHDYCPLYEGVMKAVQEGFGESVRVKGSVWSGCSISSQSC